MIEWGPTTKSFVIKEAKLCTVYTLRTSLVLLILRNVKPSSTLESLMANNFLGLCILSESQIFKLIPEGSYTPWHDRGNTILSKALSL